MTYTSSEADRNGPERARGTAASASTVLRIGQWRVDPAANELTRGARSLRLEPKVVEVLVQLARRPGEVVGREALLAAVWPGLVVGDDALTQAVIKLRRALGDDARQPTYIETISKRGYRLVAAVEAGAEPKAALTHGALPSPEGMPESPLEHGPAPARAFGAGFRRRRWAVAAVATLALAGLMAGLVLALTDLGQRLSLPWPIGPGDARPFGASGPPVIVVLPLSNLSGDPAREYFTDGLTEDLISALGRYSGLRVISRNSVEAFKHEPASTERIRDRLGASYVVKGSVRVADGRLRVSVELSDARSAQVLWSERLEGAGRDMFDIQDRIVRHIVGTLAVKVTRLEQQRLASRPPTDPAAYDLVLRARALIQRGERVANRQGRELLAQAHELAPGYAAVDVERAIAEYSRVNFGWVEDPVEALARAEQHARQALAREQQGARSRAHGVLALIHSMRGDLPQALAESGRAIELNPSDAFAFDARGAALLWMGRFEAAIESLETALRFDPAGRSSGSGFGLALAQLMLGRHEQALASADATIARYQAASFVHAVRAAALAELGRVDEARRAAGEVRRLDPLFPAHDFGDRFVDPQHKARLQASLRKAGL